MSYAIRFLPADPARRDEPALYRSRDDYSAPGPCRVTSCAEDVEPVESPGYALRAWPSIEIRCAVDNLVADVVPLADALADCRDIEPRP